MFRFFLVCACGLFLFSKSVEAQNTWQDVIILQTSISSLNEMADVVIVPVLSKDKKGEVAALAGFKEDVIEQALARGNVSLKSGEITVLYGTGDSDARYVVVCLGEESELNANTVRKAYGEACKFCSNKQWTKRVAIIPLKHEEGSVFMRAMFEGVCFNNYYYGIFSSFENRPLVISEIVFAGLTECEKDLLERVKILADATHGVQDLINANADVVTPKRLAEEAMKIAAEVPYIKCTVLNKKQLEAERMNLLLAVGRGSSYEPTLSILEYRGNPSEQRAIALVGKGVTFDTGGLNLKPTGYMEDMKVDMSGAATVMGLIKAAALLKLPVNIIAVVPAAENAIGPNSVKPGDIYKSRSGLTVEIANTDAEGRLILADALTYVQDNYELWGIIDIATLTGSIVVALGSDLTGLFSNDDAMADVLSKTGEDTGDLVWRMPLYKPYREMLDSEFADIKNCASGRKAGAITAGLFLKEFIKNDTPWVHLDIAGTATISTEVPFATGACMRLLTSFLEQPR